MMKEAGVLLFRSCLEERGKIYIVHIFLYGLYIFFHSLLPHYLGETILCRTQPVLVSCGDTKYHEGLGTHGTVMPDDINEPHSVMTASRLLSPIEDRAGSITETFSRTTTRSCVYLCVTFLIYK